MTALVGTRHLVRLALRRDRIILPIWTILFAVIPSSGARAYEQFYPTPADRASLAAGGKNPSVNLVYGPTFDLTTAGGWTAWRYGLLMAVFVSLVAIFTVTRHTRAEEDTGRLELIGSTVVGRYAALTAGVLVAAGYSLVTGVLLALMLIGAGLGAGGAFALGLGVASAGLVFTAVAAVAAQLTEYSRTANGIASAALGVAFLLRAVGDSSSATWLSWLSPLGWATHIRPYAGERWWVLGLALAFTVAVASAAFVLLPRRDIGAGLLPARLGSPRAPAALSGPLGLAWRLQRGSLIGWLIGLALVGAVFGSIANGIGDVVGDSQQVRDILARMGGVSGLVDAFLASMTGLFGMLAAVYGVQATLRMRSEETAFRVEPLLATGVGRLRWTASHLAFGLLGTAALLLAGGFFLGLTHGLRVGDVSGQVPSVLEGAVAQLPAAWLVTSLAIVLFGLLPRFATAVWALLAVFLLLSWFGPVMQLNQAILDLSPFAHIPRIPGHELTATPLLWLTGLTAVALAAGLTGFRQRDIG
ncbi:MAG TPA: ABC transporter permease [Actinophytocola sp.]|uniref:ABC transporter permease n=1 Tax=Actinophytocola sp. TaxID=1872138 RepID=UPI002DDD5A34|nr:ABC transporter permease [Actinophytocola sp.]HEV2782314.1 ABC transporter permease [Actinophytocola sp.]